MYISIHQQHEIHLQHNVSINNIKARAILTSHVTITVTATLTELPVMGQYYPNGASFYANSLNVALEEQPIFKDSFINLTFKCLQCNKARSL